MAKEDDTKLGDASFQYLHWGKLERPDSVEKLDRRPGADITARQQGELLAQLCKDWVATNK
jgi:hypothetical protein